MKRKFSAMLVLVLIVVQVLTAIPGFAAAGQAKPFTDVTDGHWAAKALKQWTDNGIVSGYTDGSFHPNSPVTRAEFAVTMNRLFGFQQQSASAAADVKQGAWYGADASKALAAGYLAVDGQGRFQPSRPLTRAEAALAFAKLFELNGAVNAAASFKDLGGVDADTAKAVAALQAAGYLKGFADGTYRPQSPVTRAELVSIVDRMVSGYVHAAGDASLGTVHGSVLVNSADAVLKDTVVEGNLYLAEGIGAGNATLNHVTVKGKTFVRGGGEHSVGIVDSVIGELEVNKADNQLRVYVSGSTSVANVTVASGAKLEEVNATGDGFKDVAVTAGAGDVSLNGTFANVSTAGGADANLTLTVSGTVDQLSLAGKSNIVLADNAEVKLLQTQAGANASTVAGAGKIGKLDNKAEGVIVNGSAAPSGASDGIVVNVPPSSNGNNGNNGNGNNGNGNNGNNGNGNSGNNGNNGNNGNGGGSVDPWTLVWRDEFDGNAVDTSKWTYDLGDGSETGNPGWGNNELEYYTKQNATVQDGHLVITAKKEDMEGKPYTSSRLKTKGLFSKAYGKFEIRAKLPVGKGMWPAIWALPENSVYGTWAASGEIDIMEAHGSNPYGVSGTIHYGEQAPGNTYTGHDYVFPDNGRIDDYHTYSIEWEPGEIRWLVDGVVYQTQNDWYSKSLGQPANNAYPAPFDQPFHLLLNLAVGGNFDGNPTDATVFPQTMDVDYVRVYELTGRPYKQAVPPVTPKEDYAPGSNLPQAPDGNLVYNNNFTQPLAEGETGLGIPNTAHWELFTEGSAAASVSIDTIDQQNFAKVAITNGGSNTYSVQPKAIVSLAKGHFYKLTFKAKTDTTRNIIVRATGNESRGFAGYSEALQANLTSNIQTFTTMFQMKRDSDPVARIEFNMGTNAHPVWIGDIHLVEIDSIPFDHDSPKTPLGDGNHLYNGTFDLGETNRMSYWHFATAEGAYATASVDPTERKLKVAITGGGGAADDITLVQKGMFLLNGHDYKVTFDTNADAERQAVVELRGKNGNLFASQNVTIPAGAGTVTATFMHLAGANDPEGQFVIALGGQTGTVKLDNIKLIRTSVYFQPGTVYYPLQNGDFSAGLTAWQHVGIEGGAESTTAENGEAKVHVTGTGTYPYSIMLFQDGITLANGLDYVVEFDARSTIARKIEVDAENASYTRFFDQTVDVPAAADASGNQHYKIEFRAPSVQTVAMKFFLGKVAETSIAQAHDIYISNVKFYVKGAPVLQSPSLQPDGTNNTAGQPIELTFVDNADWRAAVTAVKAGDTVIPANSYTLAAGKLTIQASAFPGAGIYPIVVQADGYADVAFTQRVLESDGNLVQNGSFAATMNGWDHWSSDDGASMTYASVDGAAKIDIAVSGNETWSNQFFQKGIPMEAGKTYELSFRAKSTIARALTVEFTGTTGGSAPFSLTTDWQTFTKKFTVSGAAALQLNYLIGKVPSGDATANTTPHTIYLDDISVKEATPDAPPSGTLDNGTFNAAQGMAGWTYYLADGAESDTDPVAASGELKVSLAGNGLHNYSAQVDYTGLKLTQGKTYKLTFDARTSLAGGRNIQVAVEHNGEPYTKYLDTKLVALTGTNQTFTYTFTMNGATDAGTHLVFLLGVIDDGNAATTDTISTAHDIFFDNISLVEVV